MEGYRQDWGLSFQKDTVARGGWYVEHLLWANPLSYSYVTSVKKIFSPEFSFKSIDSLDTIGGMHR